ncbi:MAG: response regulator [Verrucomicrobiales bacterium]
MMTVGKVGKPLNILIVENHSDTLRWLSLYLEDQDHSVTGAKNLKEGAAKLAAGAFDVVISDIGLPDGKGWDLLKAVPVNKLPFAIAMSGFGMNADNERSKAAGFRHHLLKPFKMPELDRMLEEALRERDGK